MSFFEDLFGGSGAAEEAAQAQIRGYEQGLGYAENKFGAGREAITAGYGGARGAFEPLAGLGRAGAGLYGDITGVGGIEGQNRARALFMTDPGYQFAVDEALRATERQRGTGGFQGSGNVLTALTDRASGLASQQYGNWVNRVAPFLNFGLGAAGGLGSTYTGEAEALNRNLTGLGNIGYGTHVGMGGALAGGILGAQKEDTAMAQGLADFGTKLLGFALAPATGGLSLGGLGAGNLFMGGGSPSGYGYG